MHEDYYSYIGKWFRRWAPIYDLITLPISRVRDKVVDLTDAEKGSKILDVCTGTGAQAFAFGKRGYDVVGIDLSEDMLKVAERKNNYQSVRFEGADATRMPYEDGCFDVSCISLALHDMPHDVREKVLDEMRRVSKKIVVVDYHIPPNRIHKWFHISFISLYESRYFKDFAKRDLEQLLRGRGLRVVKDGYGLIDSLRMFVCEV